MDTQTVIDITGKHGTFDAECMGDHRRKGTETSWSSSQSNKTIKIIFKKSVP